MATILQATGLSRSFGAVTAAADVNVAIREGEIVGVIGSNGAGKTTFLNMVTGYLRPSEGSIRFRGREIVGLSPRQVTRIGVRRSFQVAQLFSQLSVLENMLIACSLLGGSRLSPFVPLKTAASVRTARSALDDFQIGGYAGSQVSILPQGVRKLLDIAMAMVGRPSLLLLDEPTSGVAIEEKFGLMDTVMEGVKRSGAATLFVEHDMEIVSRYASRVIAFYDGRVIADAPAQEALNHPKVREYVIGSELHRQAAEGPAHAAH